MIDDRDRRISAKLDRDIVALRSYKDWSDFELRDHRDAALAEAKVQYTLAHNRDDHPDASKRRLNSARYVHILNARAATYHAALKDRHRQGDH